MEGTRELLSVRVESGRSRSRHHEHPSDTRNYCVGMTNEAKMDKQRRKGVAVEAEGLKVCWSYLCPAGIYGDKNKAYPLVRDRTLCHGRGKTASPRH